jgi:hypothetical protein
MNAHPVRDAEGQIAVVRERRPAGGAGSLVQIQNLVADGQRDQGIELAGAGSS